MHFAKIAASKFACTPILDKVGTTCLFFVNENHSLSEWIKGLSYGQIKSPVLEFVLVVIFFKQIVWRALQNIAQRLKIIEFYA